MEVTIAGLVCALFVVIPVYGFLGEQHDDYSQKELDAVAEMYRYKENHPIRLVRETDEEHRHHHHHHPHHRHMEYRHCCGGHKSRNHTAGKQRWEDVKVCVDKVKANSKEIFVNPITDAFSCEKMKEMKKRHYCVADCVMKQAGALTADDKVNTEKTKEFITRDISVDWLKEIATSAVDKCAAIKDDSLLKEEEKLQCSPKAVHLKHCVWRQVILTCPTDHYKKSDYCTQVKKAFEEMEGPSA